MNMRVSDETIKLIVPHPQTPKEQSTRESSSGQKPVSAILPDLLPALLAHVQQLNADSDDGINKKSRELRDLIENNPGALPLLLTENAARQQRSIAMLRADPSKLVDRSDPVHQAVQDFLASRLADSKPMSQEEIIDVVDTFTKILTEAKADTVDVDSDVLGKYAKFMTGLSEFAAAVNSAQNVDKNGKITLDRAKLVELIQAFNGTWGSPIKTFESEADAKSFAERFRGNTVKIYTRVISGHTVYIVNFNLNVIDPIIDVIAAPKKANDDYTASEYFKYLLANGDYPGSVDDVSKLLREDLNSASSQTLQLATNDAQKTFQTDLDLQISGFSRSNSQFDNLTKLLTSLLATLTDIYKSYLNS